jgi:cytochrome P450
LRSYFIEEISQRSASPGDDLISVLVSAQDETDTLSLDELLALVLLLLFAGDTTTNLIANGLLALSSHPDQLRCLGLAPEVLTPNAVEEVLRYDSPVQMVMRFCTRDRHPHSHSRGCDSEGWAVRRDHAGDGAGVRAMSRAGAQRPRDDG